MVTGGHGFEHDPFFSLFKGYDDIEYVEAQQKDHSGIFEDVSGWDYDVIVLYNMSDFQVHDETYNYCGFEKDNHVLLTTNHPE